MSLHLSLLAVLLMAQAVAPKPDTVESLRVTVSQQQQQIRELSNEVVRLRIELKTQSAAARDLAEQIVRAEIQQDNQRRQDAASKASPSAAPKPTSTEQPKP